MAGWFTSRIRAAENFLAKIDQTAADSLKKENGQRSGPFGSDSEYSDPETFHGYSRKSVSAQQDVLNVSEGSMTSTAAADDSQSRKGRASKTSSNQAGTSSGRHAASSQIPKPGTRGKRSTRASYESDASEADDWTELLSISDAAPSIGGAVVISGSSISLGANQVEPASDPSQSKTSRVSRLSTGGSPMPQKAKSISSSPFIPRSAVSGQPSLETSKPAIANTPMASQSNVRMPKSVKAGPAIPGAVKTASVADSSAADALAAARMFRTESKKRRVAISEGKADAAGTLISAPVKPASLAVDKPTTLAWNVPIPVAVASVETVTTINLKSRIQNEQATGSSAGSFSSLNESDGASASSSFVPMNDVAVDAQQPKTDKEDIEDVNIDPAVLPQLPQKTSSEASSSPPLDAISARDESLKASNSELLSSIGTTVSAELDGSGQVLAQEPPQTSGIVREISFRQNEPSEVRQLSSCQLDNSLDSSEPFPGGLSSQARVGDKSNPTSSLPSAPPFAFPASAMEVTVPLGVMAAAETGLVEAGKDASWPGDDLSTNENAFSLGSNRSDDLAADFTNRVNKSMRSDLNVDDTLTEALSQENTDTADLHSNSEVSEENVGERVETSLQGEAATWQGASEVLEVASSSVEDTVVENLGPDTRSEAGEQALETGGLQDGTAGAHAEVHGSEAGGVDGGVRLDREAEGCDDDELQVEERRADEETSLERSEGIVAEVPETEGGIFETKGQELEHAASKVTSGQSVEAHGSPSESTGESDVVSSQAVEDVSPLGMLGVPENVPSGNRSDDLLDAFVEQMMLKPSKAEEGPGVLRQGSQSDTTVPHARKLLGPGRGARTENSGKGVHKGGPLGRVVGQTVSRQLAVGRKQLAGKQVLQNGDDSDAASSYESSDSGSDSGSEEEEEDDEAKAAMERAAAMKAEMEKAAATAAAVARETLALQTARVALKERQDIAAGLAVEEETFQRAAAEAAEQHAREVAKLCASTEEKLAALAVEKDAHTATRLDAQNREAQLEAENAVQARALAAAQRALEDAVEKVVQAKGVVEALEASRNSLLREVQEVKRRMDYAGRDGGSRGNAGAEEGLMLEEISRLQGQIEQRMEQAEVLEERLEMVSGSQRQPSAMEAELEHRLKQLIDHLIQKQSQVEALASEKATFTFRLETVSAALRDEKVAAASRAAKRKKVSGVAIGDWPGANDEDLEFGLSRAYVMNRSQKQNGLEADLGYGKKVNEVVSRINDFAWDVDTWVLGGASYIRTNGIVRRMVWMYLLLLHFWVLFVWFMHSSVPPLVEPRLP